MAVTWSTRSSGAMLAWVSRCTEYTRTGVRPIRTIAAVAVRRCPRKTLACGSTTFQALSIGQRVRSAGPKNVSVIGLMLAGR
jgi:hypothetical protein